MSKNTEKSKQKMDIASEIEKRVLEALKNYCLNNSYSMRNPKVPAIKRGMTLAEDLNMDALDIAEAVITVEGAFSDEGLYIPSDAEIRTTDDLISVVQNLLWDSYGKVGRMTARERAKVVMESCYAVADNENVKEITFREAVERGYLSRRASNAIKRIGNRLFDSPMSTIVGFTWKRNINPCLVHFKDGTSVPLKGFGQGVCEEIMALKGRMRT